MYAGLVIRKKGKGYSLQFAVSEKGKPQILDIFEPRRAMQLRSIATPEAQFSSANLPAKVSLYGSVVEVLAVSDRTVTYRVLSGFSPDESIVVSRSGTLPVAR